MFRTGPRWCRGLSGSVSSRVYPFTRPIRPRGHHVRDGPRPGRWTQVAEGLGRGWTDGGLCAGQLGRAEPRSSARGGGGVRPHLRRQDLRQLEDAVDLVGDDDVGLEVGHVQIGASLAADLRDPDEGHVRDQAALAEQVRNRAHSWVEAALDLARSAATPWSRRLSSGQREGASGSMSAITASYCSAVTTRLPTSAGLEPYVTSGRSGKEPLCSRVSEVRQSVPY